jgi:dolichol-phosphate mannosyltransferase
MTAAYNEAGNINNFIAEVRAALGDAEILIVEDNSPDGTGDIIGELMENDDKLHIISRQGKLGVGSAHLEGIKWAYAQEFTQLVTMDCDFAHKPSDIALFLKEAETSDVVVGNRFVLGDSLAGWNWRRKLLTHLGHRVTKMFLGIPFDATGAYRAYRLDKIDQRIFGLVNSGSYSFFFESMFVFCNNGLKVTEVPIQLPARTYGSSKMRLTDVVWSVCFILLLALRRVFKSSSFKK